MKRSGSADLPLHGGRVPAWLHERMARLGGAIVEYIAMEYGREELLSRISDPFWFQSFGAVLGMDWHSSGITTSVMGALKKSVNARSSDLGLYVCGGRGKQSRRTPRELLEISNRTGLDGDALVRNSRLVAKIDNTAVQDGFQIYLHSFILSDRGDWSVVQQGMNPAVGYARRYHWHSPSIHSFVSDPHKSIYGANQGTILNMVDRRAAPAQQGILNLVSDKPAKILKEAMHLHMPAHHDVKARNVDLKRLGSILYTTQEAEIPDFESLLLTEGLGPRTLQSLALVSEVIHGTSSRFDDPARFSFAHGGKDGFPTPVPLQVYDETIQFMDKVVAGAKINRTEKSTALKKLSEISQRMEKDFQPDATKYQDFLTDQVKIANAHGGRTVADDQLNQKSKQEANQLRLF